MIQVNLQRAEMFADFANCSLLLIINPFNDGVDYWFVSYGFTPANPSNHIHLNEMTKGKMINDIIKNNVVYEQQSFLTYLETVAPSKMTFPQTVKWIKIR